MNFEWINNLGEIGLPTILTILVGAFGLIKGVESLWKWCKGKFLYFYNRKRNKDKLVQDVDKHSNEIQSIHDKLDKFIDSANKQQEMNDKYDRDVARIMLLDIYEKVIAQDYITIIQLETFDSLYDSYTNKNGNGLVHNTIYPAVHKLQVKSD